MEGSMEMAPTDVPMGTLNSEMRLQQPRASLLALCMLIMQTLPTTKKHQQATVSSF